MSRPHAIISLALVVIADATEASPASGATTCNAMKTLYRDNACCGMPDKEVGFQIVPDPKHNLALSTNPCAGKKPDTDTDFNEKDCYVNGVLNAIEQAGGDVTAGFTGGLDASGRTPITGSYFKKGLCPVNVHWHLGAEHRSQGQYDESGKGPGHKGTPANVAGHTRRLADANAAVRYGFACHHYDANDPKYTTEYKWQHCVGMKVGETYEVHWPHSAIGACHTPYQYQTPFYDGVFCGWSDAVKTSVLAGNAQALVDAVGVQAQIFVIVNDENYYYPDLMRGAIVDGDFWSDVAAYTGSTTGTSRNNVQCSSYTPITWQVDRKCHLISASTFDKMCADMKQQPDDMSGDLYAHGSRELVWQNLTANNLANGNPPASR